MPQFRSAALPLKIVPPLFNRYAGGQAYGSHVDGGIRPVAGSSQSVRTDLSATLFLSDPADYDGGELTIEDMFGQRSVKLAAGDLVLYPSTSVHRVMPVTRGARLASFFWIQSMVRDNEQRALLYELDSIVQKLGGAGSAQHDEARAAGGRLSQSAALLGRQLSLSVQRKDHRHDQVQRLAGIIRGHRRQGLGAAGSGRAPHRPERPSRSCPPPRRTGHCPRGP